MGRFRPIQHQCPRCALCSGAIGAAPLGSIPLPFISGRAPVRCRGANRSRVFLPRELTGFVDGMPSGMRRAVVVSLTWIAALMLAGAAAYVVLISRTLRPVADGYLIAARVASDGPLGAVEHLWSTWVDDIISWTLTVFFVGLPFAHLPILLGSAVALLTAVVAVTAAGVVLVRRAVELPESRWALLGPIYLSLPTLWWAHFWTGTLAGIEDNEINWVDEAWQDLANYRGLPER